MRKPAFSICKNKDADQLHGNCEADQRLCFLYTNSTIPLLPKSEISCLLLSSVAVQPGLCRIWSQTPKTCFLTTMLKISHCYVEPGLPLFPFSLSLSTLSFPLLTTEIDMQMRHMRKPVFGVLRQMRHNPGCSATKDGKRLEISDLGSRRAYLHKQTW